MDTHIVKAQMGHSHNIEVVAIERISSIDFLRAVFDCHSSGKVAMPIEPGTQPNIAGISVVDRISCASGGGWFTQSISPRHDSTPAQVVHTSGSTGEPKAILLSHQSLGDVTTRLVDFMKMDASVREYVGVPVTYSFGFGRVRAVSAAGGASYLPEHGFRVDELARMLERDEVNALSAVPTLLRVLLGQRARIGSAGAKLRWLEIGSQAMTRAEKEAIRELFPNARIVQHYGLTEASRSTFLDISKEEGEALDSVGGPCGAVEVRIADDGRIAIRGPHVAAGIITAGGLQTLTDADGWLTTNDLGRMEDGRLVFGGRADDLINVGGIKVPSEVFEDRLRAIVGLDFAYAVAPGNHPLRGQIVAIAHEETASPAQVTALEAAAKQVARDMGVADSVAVFGVQTIPRTTTNKIRRKEVSAEFGAFSAQAQDPAKDAAAPGEQAAGIAEAFLAKFGEPARDRRESFRSLDGDSLSYIDMMLRLEQFLPQLPEDWESKSIDELVALADTPADVEAAFAREFGDDALDAGASFDSLGGDEAQRQRLRSQLKAFISPLPADWHEMSIGALSTLAEQRAAPAKPGKWAAYRPTNLDTVRGLACVLIVALHVLGVRPDRGLEVPRPSTWHAIMDALEVVRLPLFTAMAGYIYGAMPATREGFGPYMASKLKQLAVPLLFANAVFWAIKAVIFHEPGVGLLATYANGYEHLWYIYAILLMFAIVAFVDEKFHPTVGVWVALIAVPIVLYTVLPASPVTYIRKGLLLLPFFLFGLVIQRRSDWMMNPLVSVLALVMLVGSIAMKPLGQPEAVGPDQTGLITWIGGAGAVVLLLLYLPKMRGLERLAAYSFTIYLWHPAASAAMRTVLWKLGVHNTAIAFVVGLAVGVGVPVAMHLVCLRLPKYLSMPVIGK
ncbi:acyltransferase family protein [Altererythrobacter sp. B11]|uniref:acyltransferase family protein n=1 Tax=Altererythrobacter sp. B11 TaxID=2060312 RepID=UPI0011AE1BF2|nr:acyltransferase family protein [Altererythrobacter sp. B11]